MLNDKPTLPGVTPFTNPNKIKKEKRANQNIENRGMKKVRRKRSERRQRTPIP